MEVSYYWAINIPIAKLWIVTRKYAYVYVMISGIKQITYISKYTLINYDKNLYFCIQSESTKK